MKPIPKRVVAAWQETCFVSARNWARLTTFRGFALTASSYESAIEASKQLATQYREEVAASDEDKLPFMMSSLFGELLNQMEKMPKDEIIRAINGAALVLAHSILDNETTAFCELAMQVNVARSEDLLKDRNVTLADAAGRP